MENLDEALALMITKALEGMDTSIGFLQAELPEVITQLLLWHGTKSLIFTVFGIFSMFLWVPYLIKLIHGLKSYEFPEDHKFKYGEKTALFFEVGHVYSCKSHETDFTMAGGTFIVGGGIVSVLGIVIGVRVMNIEWLQIWIAPKVWLLEYAADMVK